MFLHVDDDFNLEKIADSGQCFRWLKLDNPSDLKHTEDTQNNNRPAYRIIAGKSCLYIQPLGDDQFELDCTEDDYKTFWHDYFDLGENYKSIRGRISLEDDPFLWKASEHEKGIRILKQNPWEMLITFIISQNKNIPAITRSVEMLAESCGERRVDSRGLVYYTFPEPEALAALTGEQLSACKLGYRCRYVHAAAQAVTRGEIDLNNLVSADEKTAIAALTSLLGVGVKVANCVSLFGLHHIDAFPIDVWVKRILAEQYPDGYPFERYSPYNGVYQQYMFAYYRHKETRDGSLSPSSKKTRKGDRHL